ncbi:uncharacterized protein MONOS_2073 [Monocercomonoides exilis]|uniref:uncharacterized protein n=1 Tax=Monocercomonoides exilis TaxID=2049356 RepID=UPI00355964A6|nr:hypothetical protein MONOS_2073 [Monocercomonoides exilis]|eukprot:MONOS_2073.1-p1 / transcript=MONOS_2073.1 / gene=MONOS_2073 / organism=Monocercomonoides_exilis_PA203 / gene_product=unspecified product / transcript_product=unspecified product / location=Mono_scaffold00040:121955-123519(-) / protein_length=468 / sequence_SO=supercontig / SO=protein_coding / is_pseudo=false
MNKENAAYNVGEEDDEFNEEEEEEIIEDEEEEEEGKEFKTELTEKFIKLFDELVDCNEDEQKQKIEEMNEMVNEMNEEEFESVFSEELFNKIDEMIEEKKLTLDNAILMLRHTGYYNVLKSIWIHSFEESSLCERFEKMIVDIEKKKEGKNEKLLVDLCECFTMILEYMIPENLLVICLRCLLKAASNKEENEEARKEVEMALLALRRISEYTDMSEEMYLNEIKEIIQHHQEHHNLTHLAYQSAWEFLTNIYENNKNLEELIVNKLHFVREAIKELEELKERVDWKRKKEDSTKETEEKILLEEWFQVLSSYFYSSKLWNEEIVWLIGSIVKLCRVAKDACRGIYRKCIYSFDNAARSESVKVEDFLKSGAINTVFEELYQPTLKDEITKSCLAFIYEISRRLEGKTDDEKEKVKRKEMNRKVFEKMEEEGCEDIITSFHKILLNIKNDPYYDRLSRDSSDYFVHL